jgi:hypothetical protein
MEDRRKVTVMPAQAGIHPSASDTLVARWAPAFAGATEW